MDNVSKTILYVKRIGVVTSIEVKTTGVVTSAEVKRTDVTQERFNQLAQQSSVLMFHECNFGELTISKFRKVEMRGCSWKKIVVQNGGKLRITPDRLLNKIHNVESKGDDSEVSFVNVPAEVLSESGVEYDEGPPYEISGYSKVEFLDHSNVARDIEFINQPEAQVYFDESSTFTGKLINGRRVTKRWE